MLSSIQVDKLFIREKRKKNVFTWYDDGDEISKLVFGSYKIAIRNYGFVDF